MPRSRQIGKVTREGLQGMVDYAKAQAEHYNPGNAPVTPDSHVGTRKTHREWQILELARASADQTEWQRRGFIGLATLASLHHGNDPENVVTRLLSYCMEKDGMSYHKQSGLQENLTAYLGHDKADKKRRNMVAATALSAPSLTLPEKYQGRSILTHLINRTIVPKGSAPRNIEELKEIYCLILGVPGITEPEDGDLLAQMRAVGQPYGAVASAS